jgi:ABC-type antimicrobial peptide transport system permease subunit
VFTFGTENQDGVRGFYQSPTGGPLPVVISAALAEAAAFEIDDVIVVPVSERNVPMVVRGVIDYFPTMSPAGGRFILADLESLLGHVNMMSNMIAATPNELFVTQSPIAYDAVRDALDRVFRFSGRVMDRTDMLESSRLDPLATSGWNSMVLVVLLTVIVAAGLGYANYLLLFASRIWSEIGFLQSMGLSRQQLTWLLVFEHLSIAVTGLILGTWAGFRTTNLMVSSVAVSETGERSVPPFVLITDWSLMLPTYGLLLGIFVVALALLTFNARRLGLHAIERVEAT